MRNPRKAFILLVVLSLSVPLLAAMGLYVYSQYFYLQLGAPDESLLGGVLATRIKDLAQTGILKPGQAGTPSLVVCFDRRGVPDSWKEKEYLLAEPFSYFRGMRPWWDLRAKLLDALLSQAVYRQMLRPEMGLPLVYRFSEIKSSAELRLKRHVEEIEFTGEYAKDLAEVFKTVSFRNDCADVPTTTSPVAVLKVIAVSPIVVHRLSPNPGVVLEEGFFLAEELMVPGRAVGRRVTYQVGKPLQTICAPWTGRGSWQWEVEISSDLWADSYPFHRIAGLLALAHCPWYGPCADERFVGFGSRL
ncbi:hypothetical protein [Thermoanaerobaculum aquaticum]|jgi:hypothetical protein|nr:hypothetical protein [Thermoanaerobaculum aquaticum]